MRMRRPIRLAAGFAIAAGGLVPLALTQPAQAAPGDPLTVNIIHVNDHHSHLLPNSGSVDLGTSGGEFDYEVGGWPRVHTKITELAGAVQNPIKIHAGDAITGTLFYTLFDGEADAAMMNYTCFDAFEVGNHEFDSGDDGLVTFLDYLNDPDGDGDDTNDPCNTPVLGANVLPAAGTPLNPDPDPAVTDDDYLAPYWIEEVTDSNADTQRVGFIGLDIAQKTKVSSSPLETTEFADEVATAQQYVAELTDPAFPGGPIENIVLVTHYGYENDLALAAQVPEIDAIIGGDSHSLLGSASNFGPFIDETDGLYPTVTQNADGDDVCVVQAWQYSNIVGHLELGLQNGAVTGCGGSPHMLVGNFTRTPEGSDEPVPIEGAELTEIENEITGLTSVDIVEPDAGAVALLATYAGQVEELAQEQIGTATEPLCLNRLPGDTRSAGICATDQVSESGARADVHGGFMQQVVTDAFLARAFRADVALQNAGGVRIALPAGPISVADAYENLPFANTLVEADLTGAEILATLESAVANFLDEGGSDGSYPYGSGLRWDVDLTKPAGERFSNVEAQDRATGVWGPIDPTATYTVVTNSFLMGGGDGYTPFKTAFDEGRFVDTGLDYAQSFIDWIVEDAGGQVSVPAPDEFSTQSFVPAGGEIMAPLNPTRMADTRPKTSPTVGTTFDGVGEGGGPVVPGGNPLVVQIGGRGVVPPTATAVSINVTATESTGEGYFTIWSCDGTKPVASSVNYDSDKSIANSVIVPLSADGTVCIATGVSAAHVIVDVTGWSASHPAYTELEPARLLDTRPQISATSGVTVDGLHRNQGPLDPGERIVLPVVGRGGVPEGTVAVALNLTSTGSAGPGYLIMWPCDADKPVASTVNYVDFRAIANSIVVPVAADGTICIESGVAATDVVADVTGAYAATDDFGGVVPARLADTRPETSPTVGTTVDGVGQGGGPLEPGEILTIQVTGRGAPGSLVPDDANVVALNLTATEASGPGHLTAWPCDQDMPVASSLNYLGSMHNAANGIVVDLSADGTVCVAAGVSSAHVVADVNAFYR
jgi:5'-nucleotidase/UDP-sugar diphosphatase